MRTHCLAFVTVLVALTFSACGVGGSSTPLGQAAEVAPPPATFEGPVTKAVCGPGSSTEDDAGALQGQITKEDRASTRSTLGYSCNLEKVGQWQGDGASWQFTWYDDCGYYDTASGNNSRRPAGMTGSVAVDGADPANPAATKYLETPGMIDPWESLKVNDKQVLLAAIENKQGNGASLDVYDISVDCRQPQLVFAGVLGGNGHAGDWALNGDTYYGEALCAAPTAYNMRDPAHPTVLATPAQFPGGTCTHDLNTNDDGTRLYFAQTSGGNGLDILDVSDIQNTKADPVISLISSLYWTDGSTAQQTLRVKIADKPYILFTDEGGHGAARLIDISDETAPFIASKLKLEVHMPENATTVQGDTTADGLFGYEGHYCGVDDTHNTQAIACGYFQSGIRVFDVRDPYHPKEIAYFNPPAQAGKVLDGSNHSGAKTADWCSAQVRFVKTADGGGQLWTTCQDNGFLILKFTNDAWPFKN